VNNFEGKIYGCSLYTLNLEYISTNFLVEEKYFSFVGHIHLQEREFCYSYLPDPIYYDMLFGKGRVELLLSENYCVMKFNTMVSLLLMINWKFATQIHHLVKITPSRGILII
jgi:hypothetical protein